MSAETQNRVATVLDRIRDQVLADPDDAVVYSEKLELMLEELRGDDFFGTEGQNDPRGDGRDSDEWSMDFVQGVDD